MFRRIKEYKRKIKWYLQKKIIGYSDIDVWNVGYSVARYALPILKAYRDNPPIGFPFNEDMNYEKWLEILDKIIFSMEYMAEDRFEPENYKKVQEGCELFGKYLQNLWD